MTTQHQAHSSTSTLARNLPPLPLDEWEDSKDTLHRLAQIIGKIRMKTMPHMNHWWHVTLAVSSRGLTTGPMPYGDLSFTIDLDLVEHQTVITTSAGAADAFPLGEGSIASLYATLFERLSGLGIDITINPVPYMLRDITPYNEDTEHGAYDRPHVERFFHIISTVDFIFKEFSGRFTGKQSPVNLYWHSFDLALGRFSGKRAPDRPNATRSDREAYSHEIISVGFWPGDASNRTPGFYSYTAPEPPGLQDEPLQPDGAFWTEVPGGSHTAIYPYDTFRAAPDPRSALLQFLQSAYDAGSKRAGWDRAALETVTF